MSQSSIFGLYTNDLSNKTRSKTISWCSQKPGSTPNLPRSSFSTQLPIQTKSNVSQDFLQAKLSEEMGVVNPYQSIGLFMKFITGKITLLEQNIHYFNSTFPKSFSKLQKTIACLDQVPEISSPIQKNLTALWNQLFTAQQLQNELQLQLDSMNSMRDEIHVTLGLPNEDRITSKLVANNSFRTSTTSMDPQQSNDRTMGPSQQTIKLFAKLPKQISEAALEKPELMRLSAVYELIETEADYVKDLNTMVSFHKAQMKDSRKFTDLEINQIFSNVEQLIQSNNSLLSKLNQKRETNAFISEVGDALIDCAELFNVYSVYAANYPAAMKLVYSFQQNSEYKDLFQKWMTSPEARGLSLESFLIKPVQRICKYPLLIRELEKYSERAGNTKDQQLLKKAAEKIEQVVTSVNEATRAAEEKQRILSISSIIESETPLDLADKVFLKDGSLVRYINGKPKDRYVVLYDDLILICKSIVPPAGTIRGPTKYELESGYTLTELILKTDNKEIIKTTKNSNILCFEVITDGGEQLILGSNSSEDMLKWLDIFQIAFKDITDEHRSAVISLDSSRTIEKQSSTPDSLLSFGKNAIAVKPKIKIGLSSVAILKAASRKSRLELKASFLDQDPEMVKIDDVIYKRTLSATGHPYYYTNTSKQTLWKLPGDYVVYSQPNEPSTTQPETAEEKQTSLSNSQFQSQNISQSPSDQSDVEEEEGMSLEIVPGFSNWRKVKRIDTMPYYFHIVSQETRWDPPVSN